MIIRKKNKVSEESLKLSIDIIRRIISIICIKLIASLFGILNYLYLTDVNFNAPVFQIPSRFIDKLSLPGFAISGFLIGIGNQMCNGGLIYHFVCGIPSLSINSFITVLLTFLFAFLSNRLINLSSNFLLKTQYLYIDLLDQNYVYISFGVCTTSICLFFIFLIAYFAKCNQLQKFLMTKKSKIFLF